MPIPDVAMVFAAGLGTRMRPLTETMPKPLISVAKRSMLDHTLDRLADAGVRHAIVNVHYLADQIEASLAGRTAPSIIISDERDRLLDQGGGIKKALPLLGPAPFLICNTDALWLEGPTSNLRRLAAHWDPHRMDILLLVASTTTSIGVDWPGDFAMDEDGRLSRRQEHAVTPFVYSGIGIVKPELFAETQADVFRLAPFFFAAAEAGRLFGTRLEGLWLHVGTPEALAEAEDVIEHSNR
ncbi:nucleotidyltransferase family protein [Lichenihabitans psoromatis]|uniref:nucleotidyltransferase family protein n=1 Tax=Lichenihabitans psoromatis TaxID=2528642 RepID=UPI001036673E|nr:nucleotidyltransferase family protein [Lichenihabitans psoromatis]